MNGWINYGLILQARLSSSRLPGKVLMDMGGQEMLYRQIDRLKNGISSDIPIIVATSDHSSDDSIEAFCIDHGIKIFRGPLDDVMQRFILCATKFRIKNILRVCGDDPLIDPEVISALVSKHKEQHDDFIFATHRDGWPYGCAAELISLDSLKTIHPKTKNTSHREHTIPYFFENINEFNITKLNSDQSMNRPDYFFTVDYKEDFELASQIFKIFKDKGNYFSHKEFIAMVDENKEILALNRHLHEGYDPRFDL